MRLIRLLLTTLTASACICAVTAVAAHADEPWSWPVGRDGLGRAFEKPDSEYGAGHRGLDIAAPAGTAVRAVAPGTVTFVGRVGTVDVITVLHGAERSTYQPVLAGVRQGDAVERGEVLGTLLPGPSHCAGPCLHLGRVGQADRDYRDPLELLGGGRFRLISPDGPPPTPPAGAGGALLDPLNGPVSSPFGMRVHPVTGVRKLHDGTDFAAPCGTPVRAASSGVVEATPTDAGYGQRVLLDHSDGLTSGYAHLSSRSVTVGEKVDAGQVVGRVGSTGMSTGCHLHFMVLDHGAPTNPSPYL
ncbi:peptidoglycan DD-metalloendopeptidase family protein [Aeromicrobium sp. CF3.5]|uniref:M23 family metallopeptidase n=1 Tax=Aeromicrobium sp. CF3.5 TaxID=3373078 RepID=UPI003EE571D6